MITLATLAADGIDVMAMLPALIPAVGIGLLIILDALLPARALPVSWSRAVASLVLLVGAVASATHFLPGGRRGATLCTDSVCLWRTGNLEAALQVGILLTALLAVGVPIVRPRLRHAMAVREDVVPMILILAATTGGASAVASADLATWLVSIELATIPIVALVAMHRTPQAARAALSFLVTVLVGFVASALGVALWLAATGSLLLDAKSVGVAMGSDSTSGLLVLATALLVLGVGVKLAMVPLHLWAPAVYEYADLRTVAFLGGASKIAAVGALIAVLRPVVAAGGSGADTTAFTWVLGVLAALSLLVALPVALRQTSTRRFLAWSAVGGAGWSLIPLAGMSENSARGAAASVLVLSVASVAAITVVAVLEASTSRASSTLEDTRGLVAQSPLAAVTLVFALLSLAGMPPSIVGLMAKVLAISPVIATRMWALAALAIVAVVAGLALYLRWLSFALSEATTPPAKLRPSLAPSLVMVVTLLALVVLSVLPGALVAALS